MERELSMRKFQRQKLPGAIESGSNRFKRTLEKKSAGSHAADPEIGIPRQSPNSTFQYAKSRKCRQLSCSLLSKVM